MKKKMAAMGETFFLLLIVVSLALTTYNIVTSTTTSLKPDLPGTQHVSVDSSGSISANRQPQSRTFHTAVTGDDSVYITWQCRVMYYWYMKNKGPDMGGFTRILHSGEADRYINEIPTFVTQSLPSGVDEGYVVLNRPWGLKQWLEQADIKEEYEFSYIWMAEPDHLIVRPIPNLALDGSGAAFPFFYIDPKKYEHILARHFPGRKLPFSKIDSIGNSPVIIEKAALKKIVPSWVNISLSLKKDKEADKLFGWVLEMYAYAMASAQHETTYILRKDFMIQPPWETEVRDTFIIHYTYGCDYDMRGNFMPGKIGEWRFDKRSYGVTSLPRNLTLPPPGVPQSVVTMINMFNEATANIPNWDS